LAQDRRCQEGSDRTRLRLFRKARFSQPINQVLHIFCAFEVGYPSLETDRLVALWREAPCFGCLMISDMPAPGMLRVRFNRCCGLSRHPALRAGRARRVAERRRGGATVEQAGKAGNKPE
jgi:hypothetical protein